MSKRYSNRKRDKVAFVLYFVVLLSITACVMPAPPEETEVEPNEWVTSSEVPVSEPEDPKPPQIAGFSERLNLMVDTLEGTEYHCTCVSDP